MIHIVFFAPYESCVPVIEEVFAEHYDHDILSHETIVDSYNNRLMQINADAIISRGFTAHTMQMRGLPGAELEISGYDVIIAIDRCLRQYHSTKIATVGAQNMLYGVEAIASVFPDIELLNYTAKDEALLEECIDCAIADGAQTIVGGCSSVALAKQKGIPAVLIESSKQAISSVISKAILVVQIERRERRRSQEIANIMDYSFQGIISTDYQGKIILANQYSRTAFNGYQELSGLSVNTLFPLIPVNDVIQRGQKVLSEIHDAGSQQYMVNCVPITDGHKNSGCVLTFQEITKIQKEEEKIRKRIHHQGFTARYNFGDILHCDMKMQEVVRIAVNYSNSNSNLLIHGETGTGKELFAQSIHNASSRKSKPFVAINCAALPDELLESELFGYAQGAFTGAAKGGKMGLFEIAHTGTIFLDEIGDISPKLQSRLLRVLQEREIIRVGHNAVIPIDVRVISATNRNLREEVHKGNFRQDLLYRLDVLELQIPPLRERKPDIPLLVNHFITNEQQKNGCDLHQINDEGMALLTSYHWYGNIRELRNFCERICVLCTNSTARREDIIRALPDYEIDHNQSPAAPERESSNNPVDAVWDAEKQMISEALSVNHYHRGKTAAYLGMDKSTLWRKMKKYNIPKQS